MKHFIYLLIFLCNAMVMHGKVYRVLFIGNSYTSYNDLPNTFAQICISMGDSVFVNSSTAGGATFNAQSVNPANITLLQQGNWDFVVLQGQSQEPSFPPSQVQTQVYPYAKSLDSLAKKYNPCAEIFYFMTWGRKNGDAANCAGYPPICTYTGMQQRLRESYQYMAQANASSTSPVGIVWQKVRKTDSTIELYNPDESHPSLKGTYLAACTFYQSFFHKNITAAAFVSTGVTVAEANIIKTACKQIVLDSLTTWQQYGTMPIATFTAAITNKSLNITNTSIHQTKTTYAFGDAQTSVSNATAVQYTYANSGTYTVVQTIENTCGKTDTAAAIVEAKEPLAITTIKNTSITTVRKNNIITFANLPSKCCVQVYSIVGQLLQTKQASNQIAEFNLVENAIIIYKIVLADKTILSGKI